MTQKRPLRTLAAGLAALALTLTPVHAVKTTYSDVDESLWYAAPIAFCQQHQLMDGISSSVFLPSALITRAALTEALYRLEGSPAPEPGGTEGGTPPEEESEEEKKPEEEKKKPEEEKKPEDAEEKNGADGKDAEEELPFPDVGADHPNLAAIRWAKESGAVSGYPDGRFGPEDPITREQIAVLLWTDQGRPEAASPTPYADREDISDWAAAAVDWANSVKLMQGTPDNRFLPLENTSRAEGATIIASYAREFYGMTEGYTLPEPSEIPPNPYRDGAFQLDERGYLSYEDAPFTRGLDVSAHQKEVDWAKVAAAGMDFAMIRAGYRGYTLGTIQKDAYFEANMAGALANGLEVGVYFFSQALTPAEAEEEARLLLEWIKDYPITYPVVFDWEEQDKEGSRTKDTDGNTITACALAFCQVVEDAGYTPMLYGSPRKVYTGGIMLEYLQGYPFWLAHYTKDTAPTTFRYHYDMWQYSSSGAVDGIEGSVDLNICFWSPGGAVQPDPEEPPWWFRP